MSWETPLIVGLIGGSGVALLMSELVPRRPKLASALMRLGEREIAADAEAPDLKTRIGEWGIRHLAGRPGFKVPEADLRILGQTPANFFYGKIILLLLLAVLVPTFLTVLMAALGFPPLVPAITMLLVVPLGLLAVILGDLLVTTKATEARDEFSRAISAYLELVALERRRGATTSVALEEAAKIGDGWVFRRILSALRQAKIAGTQPWTALDQLSDQLNVPELGDVAHITQLAGEEGTSVYTTLRARGIAMRTKILNAEHRTANQVSERMTYPQAFLGVVFLAILVTPPLMQLLNS